MQVNSGRFLETPVLKPIGDSSVRAFLSSGVRLVLHGGGRSANLADFSEHHCFELVDYTKALRYQKSENPHREWV